MDPIQIETVRKWSFSLALQAAIWGAPLVIMYDLRQRHCTGSSAKIPPNTLARMESILTPEIAEMAAYVTPNVNVIYGFGFMDLSVDPIVLSVPDSKGRYYMVQLVDMWTNTFAYVGGKTTGYGGGKFLLTGSGWKGEIPSGLKEIRCPTRWVLVQPRVHIYKEAKVDLEGAREVLGQIVAISLSQYLGEKEKILPEYDYISPEKQNSDRAISMLDYKDPLQFWEMLSDGLNENHPPSDQISALLPLFKPLGIEFGKRWDRSQLPLVLLDPMYEAAKQIGAMLGHFPWKQAYQGAHFPPKTIGAFGTDYLMRAIIARIGLTANTPFEALYWIYPKDTSGNPLTGEKKYKMTFQEGIPYYEPGFWSITLYDALNNYTVPNLIDRYMLGSDTKDLKTNPDGSFTFYIQKDSPGKELESNWLPTPPGSFYLIARCFAPKPEAIALLSDMNSWPIPVVVEVC